MTKGKDVNLISVLSVLILAVSLLLSIVNITGAWFTDDSSTGKTISAIIKTGEANLNVYQENSTGTQTMLSKSLPTGYTQLEYIATTGTQYIDTGFQPTPSTVKYETTISFDDITGTRGLFGARISSPNNQAVNVFCINSSSSSAYLRLDWADSGSSCTYSVRAGNKYTLLCYQNSVTINNTTKTGTIEKSTTQLEGNFYVGNFNNGTAAPYANGMIGKIYYGRLYDNGTLMRNFIPAKNASGVVGMYDLVEGKFYTNAGTGTFTAGAEQKSGSGISLAYDTTNKTNNKVDVENTNSLKLLLKNEDLGSSFGVKYKVTFYAATASGKVELSSSISGMTAQTSSSNGFVFNSTDGYYYYQNSAGTNVVFEPATSSGATSKYLMTGYSINYTNATKNLLGGNAIYMEISVESVAV